MAPIYQIRDWDKHYENFKSRPLDRCSYVCIPNKQDGDGLTTILLEKDGAAIYGIWHLITGLCSRQRRPRQGWLTDNGGPDGRPLDAAGLAKRWRRRPSEIQRALTFLTDAVGWVRRYQSIEEVSGEGWLKDTAPIPNGYRTDTEVSGNRMEWNGTEGKERNGREGGVPVSTPPQKGTEGNGTAGPATLGTPPAGSERPEDPPPGSDPGWNMAAARVVAGLPKEPEPTRPKRFTPEELAARKAKVKAELAAIAETETKAESA
jgi:hypothetical protein